MMFLQAHDAIKSSGGKGTPEMLPATDENIKKVILGAGDQAGTVRTVKRGAHTEIIE